MNAEHKRLPVFGRRPLLPVGTGAPAGTRCVQLQIPDSDMAVRQLMGVLRLLVFWQSFERETSHYGAAWAGAWRDALALSIGGCEGMAIEFMQDDCGLYFREVGAEEWTQIYDGLHCLESDAAHEYFDGLMGDYIDQLIDDGVLQRAGGQPGPENPPIPGACTTYHVVLSGNEQWLLPSDLGYGDSVIVTNLKGGWTDGSLAWYCPDGSRYLASICDELLKTHQDGDVLNPGAYHMALVMKVGDTWYPAPLSAFLQESGTTAIPVVFQANDGSLSDNSGNIEFDVEVCTAGWTHVLDFTTGAHGWSIMEMAGNNCGEYSAGVGFVSTTCAPYRYLTPGKVIDATVITWVKVTSTRLFSEAFETAGHLLINDDTVIFSEANTLPAGESTWEWSGEVSFTQVGILMSANTSTGDTITITKVELQGTGTDPF